MNSLDRYELSRYVDLEKQQECKVCSQNFTREDLLKEKVHKTGCDHFFHKACLDRAYEIKPSRSYYCEICTKPMNYSLDSKNWKATLERVRNQIQEFLPNGGTKRRLESHEPCGKRVYGSSHVLFTPHFEYDIWRRILMQVISREELARPDLFCDALETILAMKCVSKAFNACFSLEELVPVFQIYLNEKGMAIHEIGEEGDNPLQFSCARKNSAMTRLLLLSSNDPHKLVTQRDDSGMNAFNFELENHRDASCLKLMIELAKLNVLEECDFEWDTGVVAIDVLGKGKKSIACLDVLVEKAGEGKLAFIELAFKQMLFNGNKSLVLSLLGHLAQVPDKSAVANFCVDYAWEALMNHSIDEKHSKSWFNEFLPREVFPRFFKLAGDRAADCAFKVHEDSLNLFHMAVLTESLELVKAIIKSVGSRELELLKTRFEAVRIGNQRFENGTALEIAQFLGATEIVDYLKERIR